MTTRVPECGHPDRAHQAKGMCAQCYYADYDSRRNRRKDPTDYAPNYQQPPHKSARVPVCHSDRPHWAKGKCQQCYMAGRTNAVKADCHPDRPHVANGLCARCTSKQRYDMDPERARQLSRESQARGRERLRDQMLKAYGGRCACANCPERNPAFLALDHVERNGKEHRARVGSHVLADLRRQGWPQDGYRLLCWNCNAMTRFDGVCPHEAE